MILTLWQMKIQTHTTREPFFIVMNTQLDRNRQCSYSCGFVTASKHTGGIICVEKPPYVFMYFKVLSPFFFLEACLYYSNPNKCFRNCDPFCNSFVLRTNELACRNHSTLLKRTTYYYKIDKNDVLYIIFHHRRS